VVQQHADDRDGTKAVEARHVRQGSALSVAFKGLQSRPQDQDDNHVAAAT
jgi:hypothetical protein